MKSCAGCSLLACSCWTSQSHTAHIDAMIIEDSRHKNSTVPQWLSASVWVHCFTDGYTIHSTIIITKHSNHDHSCSSIFVNFNCVVWINAFYIKPSFFKLKSNNSPPSFQSTKNSSKKIPKCNVEYSKRVLLMER